MKCFNVLIYKTQLACPLTICSDPPFMLPTSEGVVPLMPLQGRYAASFLSRGVATEGHYPGSPHSVDTIDPSRLGPNPNPGPAEVDADVLGREPHEPRLKPLTTPMPSDDRDSLLPSLSSHATQHDLHPTRTPRASSKRLERPNHLRIFIHAILCCAAYPVLYAGAIAAKDRSLFWARVIVGLWCAGVGVVIGWSLVGFAAKYMEAASKSTSPKIFAPRGCPTRSLPVLGSVGDRDPSQSQPRRTGHQIEGSRA